MADFDKVLSLCPGTKKLNFHASYAIYEKGDWADRDQLEPRHFQKWVDFCKERGLGCDFNPTFFSHPKCDPLNQVVMHCHPANLLAMTYVHDLDERTFTRTLWQMCTECIVVFPDGVNVLP